MCSSDLGVLPVELVLEGAGDEVEGARLVLHLVVVDGGDGGGVGGGGPPDPDRVGALAHAPNLHFRPSRGIGGSGKSTDSLPRLAH